MTKTKTKLFLDCDGVLTDTISGYCDLYTHLFKDYSEYKKPNPSKVNTWSLKCECPLAVDIVEEMFCNPILFDYLKLYPNCAEVIDELKGKYDIKIVTIGKPLNVASKALYFQKHLPGIEFILLGKYNVKMCKEVINMKNSIFVDDHQDNLFGSNAERKICYSDKVYPWNSNWGGERTDNWIDLYKLLK